MSLSRLIDSPHIRHEQHIITRKILNQPINQSINQSIKSKYNTYIE
jgi:hypothetical protein